MVEVHNVPRLSVVRRRHLGLDRSDGHAECAGATAATARACGTRWERRP